MEMHIGMITVSSKDDRLLVLDQDRISHAVLLVPLSTANPPEEYIGKLLRKSLKGV